MILCYFLYFLLATLPLKSDSHQPVIFSLRNSKQFVSGYLPNNAITNQSYFFAQKLAQYNNAENQNIVGSEEDKFGAKHLWDPAQYNGKLSFDYFKKNPDFMKSYFVELNQKIYFGNILPYKQQLIDKKGYSNKITIVDTNIERIRNDIDAGKVPCPKNKIGDIFRTNQRYTMTQITAKFEGENLVFKAAQLEGKFEFGLDRAGKNVVHLQKPHFEDIVTIHKDVELARFSFAELKNIEDGRIQIQEGLKETFKELKNRPVLLNEKHPSYKQLYEKVQNQCKTGRKRRSLHIGGSSCAIIVKQNGDVDYISPKEFVEAYKTSDEYGKKILAEVAIKNKDKIGFNDFNNDVDTKNMNNLLELEQTKSHVKDINKIDDTFRKPKSGSEKSSGSSIFGEKNRNIIEIDSGYKISYNNAVHSVAKYKAAKSLAHGVSNANSYLSIFFTAKTIVNGIKHNDTTSLAIVGAQLGFNTLTNTVVTAGTKYSKHVTKQLTKAVNAKYLGKITKLGKAINTASKVGKAAKIISEVAGPIGIAADVGISAWSMTKSVGRLLNATNKYERDAAIADIVGDAIDISVTAVVSVEWKIFDGENETIHGFKLWASPKSSEYVNPVFEFSPAGSAISSEIRVSTDGVTMATFLVEGLEEPDKVYGIPVDVNRFIINITSTSSHSSGGILGCSHGLRCSANQFWIFNLEANLEILDGGNCKENNCSNYIFFPTNSNERKLHFDLDTEKGRVITDEGEVVISQLTNIHELHGSKGLSANVTCSTTQVSKLDVVMITQADCQSDLIIGVEDYSRVIFQEMENDNLTSIAMELVTAIPIINEDDDYYDNNEVEDSNIDKENYTLNVDDDLTDEFNNIYENQEEINTQISNRTIHYRFAQLMSFNPEGSLSGILGVNHIYYLPFELKHLEKIDFNVMEKRLYYLIGNIECSHTMISPLYSWDQFYSQPSLYTTDGYSIQVSRDGSLWATLGDTSNEIDQESLPDLMKTASHIEITLMIEKFNSFYFIGHSGKKTDDRNVVQNMPHKTSHLAGGGANDTIYDILSLDNDVYIYTGYDEDSYTYWDGSTKQTIDLTDIVAPIRNLSGTKYVPQTISNGNKLEIFMQGYEEYFSGRVIIVNGVFPWVAKRIQLLLSGAVMEFVSDEYGTNGDFEKTTTEDFKPRNRRSVEGSNERSWAISPRPLIIPGDINIYSISTEDLEDGQDIQLESNKEGEGTFQMIRNGSDLYMTNAVSLNVTTIKAIIINDFWESNDLKGDIHEGNKDAKVLSGVTVRLPGLNVMLNDTNIINGDTGKFSSVDDISVEASAVTIKPWKQALFDFENILLEDMPEIPRSFHCEECLPWWKQTTKLVIVLVGVLSIALIVLGYFMIFIKWKKGYNAVAVTNVNCDADATSNMEMMKLKK